MPTRFAWTPSPNPTRPGDATTVCWANRTLTTLVFNNVVGLIRAEYKKDTPFQQKEQRDPQRAGLLSRVGRSGASSSLRRGRGRR